MPYCKEFQNLFQPNGLLANQLYQTLFQKLNISAADVEKAVEHLDCSQILPWLDSVYVQYSSKRPGIRPFHLGLGNPDADILIVGSELAIDTNRPNPKELANGGCTTGGYYKRLFVNEAILNYYLWFCKVNGSVIPPNCCIQDPEFPASFCHLYNDEKPWNGHYWAKISVLIGALLGRMYDNKTEAAFFRTKDVNKSFFKHVFLTELHDIPSARSTPHANGTAIANKIDDLATIPFFRKFKRIVFACKTYLDDNLPDYKQHIESKYGVTAKNQSAFRNIKDVFESPEQKIIVCSNLSGAAGWSNAELLELAAILN